MATYWEKLQDPRWQKRRLEAMQTKDFSCEVCGDSESNLHVHHKEYFRYLSPWEYNDGQLAVLCEKCHFYFHNHVDSLKLICSYIPMQKRETLAVLLGGLMDFQYESLLECCDIKDSKFLQLMYKKGIQAKKVFGKNDN